jgi:hypothetical protein
MSTIFDFFQRCVQAVQQGAMIQRESRQDKEFHFQNWVKSRLVETSHLFEEGGRNSYPDFRLVNWAEGYEVKGLAYPGRWLNYDSNSQVPAGQHNGRAIYYIFGRYPKQPDGNHYPVLDLVVCHGDFLNADSQYVHKNKAVHGFGSYGDIIIRDRKMYVVPTPYALLEGVAHYQTLVLPEAIQPPADYKEVGTIIRREASEIVVKYAFDLRNNVLTTERLPNPNAGKTHTFRALRLLSGSDAPVTLRADSAPQDADNGEVN